LEWHMRRIDLELEAVSEERFYVFFEDLETGQQWEEENSSNLDMLLGKFDLLVSRAD